MTDDVAEHLIADGEAGKRAARDAIFETREAVPPRPQSRQRLAEGHGRSGSASTERRW
jgi:hypothetical protein